MNEVWDKTDFLYADKHQRFEHMSNYVPLISLKTPYNISMTC